MSQSGSVASFDIQSAKNFGASVEYKETPVTINPDIAKDFSVDEIKNLKDMQDKYGKFTAAELKFLKENKFVMKKVTDTKIKPSTPQNSSFENYREFLALYNTVAGDRDYKERTQANAVFWTPDMFFNMYNILYTELLKETENTVFFPAMRDLSKTFYDSAAQKAVSSSGEEQAKWMKVRNYFAVPYAMLSNAKAMEPDFSGIDEKTDTSDDSKTDTIDTATAFVQNLKLDAASEASVLKDLKSIFGASGTGAPDIFAKEFKDYAEQTGVGFSVDWSQFTPRSHYTSSSLRRQFFRSMMWFSQVPFFLKSPALTSYAFAATQLFAEHPTQMSDYGKMESAIEFLVGTSDDLMPVDYMLAMEHAKTADNKEASMIDELERAHPPKIKGLLAQYTATGTEDTSDVTLMTKGMRFFSGKFIIDSYWTGQLTQGDEKNKPGYTQKLPPIPTVLEVMALLGSDYARSQIPTYDFYKPTTKEAIDKAMADLTAETKAIDASYWTENIYNGWLWTIQSLFGWQKAHKKELPSFMQSEPWDAKTLLTAAGFWTELRHATLLYAKQSAAEAGGGSPCDTRKVPPAAKSYIEPDMQAFDRLSYLANRTKAGLTEQNYNLKNMYHLDSFIAAVDLVRGYVAKQLGNAALVEPAVVKHEDKNDDGTPCIWYEMPVSDNSGVPGDWEQLRVGLLYSLEGALPDPVEGNVVPVKDKRAALVADIHTGGDTPNTDQQRYVLYEGTGVPYVIFTAVKDANGARLVVGFTYSQYEFTQLLSGKRMTDEDWQTKFYAKTDDPYQPWNYTPATWPKVNKWFEVLFPKK